MQSDLDFLQKLFDYKCFEEISYLVYSKKKLKWRLTKEMFKSTLIHNELDLNFFFLKIKDCRVILENPEIQKIIVEKYIK